MKFYSNCRELPIHNFIEISRTGDLKFLFCDYKNVTDESITSDVQNAYLEIIDELNSFFKGSGNGKMIKEAKLRALSLRFMNISILEMIIMVSGKNEEVIELSKKMKINPDNISTYKKAVNNELRKLEKQLEIIDEEKPDNELDNWEKSLILVKENGFNFDRYNTPLIEFIYAINRLEEKAKHLETLKTK